MKHGNNGSQPVTIPNPTILLAKPAPIAAPPPPKVEPPAMVVGSVEELLKAVSEGKVVRLSAEAKAEVEKFKTTHDNLETPKRLVVAEEEATAELPKLLASIAEKHKVSFSGRKVTVVFKTTPKEGETNPLVSFGPEVEVLPGTKRHGGGHGKGFKSGGEVILHPEDGKEIHFNSLHALAVSKGWKYEGRATSQVAITNPCTQAEWDALDSDGRKNLPAKYRIELVANDGKAIIHVHPVAVS